MDWIPKEISILFEIFSQHRQEIYLVGGCVRDYLLGQIPHDFDIATSATPNQVKDMMQSTPYLTVDTGIAHGTVTVIMKEIKVEVTTYREDQRYLDHRRPSGVSFTSSLIDDLKRRDFTINAMAYHPLVGVVDWFGGQEDLIHSVVRCVGNPKERFEEDALRILRCLRFASTLDFSIEEETKLQLFANCHLLDFIAWERKSEELLKLLMGRGVVEVVLDHREVIQCVLPELVSLSKETLEDLLKGLALAPQQKITRLAILLSYLDIALVKSIGTRLRLSKISQQTLVFLATHLQMAIKDDIDIKEILRISTPELVEDLLNSQKAMKLAEQHSYEQINDFLSQLPHIATEPYAIKHLAIGGNDLLPLVDGKQIGLILEELLNQVMYGKLVNEKSSLLEEAKQLIVSMNQGTKEPQ